MLAAIRPGPAPLARRTPIAPDNHAAIVGAAGGSISNLKTTVAVTSKEALEPIPKVVESDESFVIRYAAPESSTGGCRDVET